MDDVNSQGFYIVLPSNVQPNYHSDNTASRFQTTFPTSYNLSGGEWEVGLLEISYVNTIPTIINEHFTLNSSKFDDSNAKTYTFKVKGSMYFPPEERQRRRELEEWRNSKTAEELLKQPTPPHHKKDAPKSVLAGRRAFNKFTAEQDDCPFSLTFNKTTERYEIKALKRDLPPTVYLYKDEAVNLKLVNPEGRTVDGGKFRQLWTETLKKGSVYVSEVKPNALIAETIGFKIMNTECLTISIPKGFYATPDKLVEALNRDTEHPLANWDKSEASGGKQACGYRFAYNKSENRIMLGLTQHTDLTFRDDLHKLLGFSKNHYKGGRHTAERPPLMTQGIYHLYLYCDLCAPIRVGNMLVPLLRTIDVPSSKYWGQVTSTRFQRPMYNPVAKSSFNSVRIEIYDDTGQPITFSEGRTIVTLHVRPQRRL